MVGQFAGERVDLKKFNFLSSLVVLLKYYVIMPVVSTIAIIAYECISCVLKISSSSSSSSSSSVDIF